MTCIKHSLNRLIVNYKLARSFSLSHSCFDEPKQFVREKENINVGLIGSHAHGKTFISSNITKESAKKFKDVIIKTPSDIDNTKPEKKIGYSISPSHFEIIADKHRLSFTDLPGHNSYTKNMYTHMSSLDSVLFVISADEGLISSAKTQYKIAKHFGSKVVTFINHKNNPDQSMCQEIEELICCDLNDLFHDSDCDNIIGSVNSEQDPNQGVIKAIEILDKLGHDNKCSESPLIWPLEQVGNIPGKGDFVAGRVKAGKVQKGSGLYEIFYEGTSQKLNIRDIEIFKKKSNELLAGDRGGAFIKIKNDLLYKRGSVIRSANHDYVSSNVWKISIDEEIEINPKLKPVVFFDCLMEGNTTLEKINATTYNLIFPYSVMAQQGQPLLLRLREINIITANFLHPQS